MKNPIVTLKILEDQWLTERYVFVDNYQSISIYMDVKGQQKSVKNRSSGKKGKLQNDKSNT